MFIDIVRIIINEIKLDEITVTFHPINDRIEIIEVTLKKVVINGNITHLIFLKKIDKTKIINIKHLCQNFLYLFLHIQ